MYDNQLVVRFINYQCGIVANIYITLMLGKDTLFFIKIKCFFWILNSYFYIIVLYMGNSHNVPSYNIYIVQLVITD